MKRKKKKQKTKSKKMKWKKNEHEEGERQRGRIAPLSLFILQASRMKEEEFGSIVVPERNRKCLEPERGWSGCRPVRRNEGERRDLV